VLASARGQLDALASCQQPLHLWLVMACALVCGFYELLALGYHSGDGRYWWFVQPSTAVSRAAFMTSWAVVLPLFMVWTVLGICWLIDTLDSTPDCIPLFMSKAIATIQILFVVGSVAFAVLVVNVWDAEKCLETNSVAIQAVADNDLVQRWGRLKPTANAELSGGLSLNEIDKLPLHSVVSGSGNCVICLLPLARGDKVRALPGCAHEFHRPCIDLWLLRSVRCPLCNTTLRSDVPTGIIV